MKTAMIVLFLGIGLPVISFLTGLYYIKRNEDEKRQKPHAKERFTT
ncbi:MAG: hypothetical protein ACE5F7_10010 [Nitrospiria bacterium]